MSFIISALVSWYKTEPLLFLKLIKSWNWIIFKQRRHFFIPWQIG